MSRLTLSCEERPCEPSRRAQVARPYPGWLWTALAGLVVLTGLAAPAAAQTVQTLVSNSGETRPFSGSSSISAQSIRTGGHDSGYTVSQIELHAFTVASRSTTVKLYSNSDSGEPQDLVATLVNPDTFRQRQFNTFTAPSGTMLSRNTTYWIVVNEDIGDSAQRFAYSTTSSDVDTSSYEWSIGNERLIKSAPTSSWSTNTFVLSMTVKGYLTNAPPTSDTTPPTLETAEVNGATLTLTYDETLDTASVPAASDYTVSVADATRSLASATPIAVSGSTVALTLSSAVTPGQTVTVSYAVPSTNPVQDAAGNDAAVLSSQAVTNNTRIAANTVPTAAANTVTTNEDTAHTFAADDFGFMDEDSGDALESVKIESLPAAGTGELQLDNVALSSASQMVTKAQLDDGDLKYVPPANANGPAYASFNFKVNDGAADSAAPYIMTVNVTAVNDAPVFSDATLTRSVAENSAANVNVGTVIPAATDADVGATLEYSMEGADAASFNFNVSTRQITTKSGVHYDFEAKRSHSVTIKVSDGTDSDTVAVTINVTDQADTGDSSLSPSADDVVPARKSQATYSIRIEGSWNTGVTPGSVPGGAHFTTFVGGIHNDQVTFLESGGRASAGVESMAELGGTSRLVTEVNGAKPDAVRTLTLSAPGVRSSRTHNGIAFTSDHPRITLTSMIAPSPDWFVGVSGRSLLDSSGNWLSPLTVNLYPWDAGTEDGSEFSLSNASTSPKGVISSIRGRGKFTGEHIARLVFTRTGSVEQAPAAPTGYSATPSDAEVTLGWDVPTETGITGHEYRRKTDGAYGGWTAIPDSAPGGANEDSFTVTGLTNDTMYTFQLRAVNSVGGGAGSTGIAATPEEDEILPTLVLNVGVIAGDGTVNIAEKAAGFTISGDTASEAGVSITVTVGATELTATSADDSGTATWSVSVPADAPYITGTSVDVTVSATKTGFTAPGDVQRTLTVDLTAPPAPTYTAPDSLKVGVAITAMSPSGGSGIDAYKATGLPTGLSIDTGTGAISGTPDTADANTADATVTVSDAAGNSGTVDITFPAVAKGDQTLTGFQYSASSVTLLDSAPSVTAPTGVQTTLSYSATPSAACTVNSSSGALTLAGVGDCVITATAAGTDDYNEATATFTLAVQAAGELVLNLDAVATDNTVNVAEKTAGFTISGDTGTESGVDVTVQIGTETLTATSADNAGTATWSVSVPAAASYITGTSVDVQVNASKTDYTSPSAVQRTLTVDLTAPTAPTYTAPASLKVGVAITAMSPTGGIGIDAYSATGLPPGLSIAAATGVIGGTPDAADPNTADATVTASDTAGNTAEVSITFPAVVKGDQTLTGFQYSASSVTFGSTAPTVTAPGGVETTLSYSATPSTACTVVPSSGALTLAGVGGCVITATAAGTDDYNEATATFTVAVQAAGALVLNLDTIAEDNTVNIAEKTGGFTISGNTDSEAGVSITVTVGSTELTATSADDNGTATWSVSVPANASYITGTSVDVTVSATKTGFTAPGDVQRTLTVDLTAPTAPTYTAPDSLKVGVAIATMSPTDGSGIDEYSATGLPPGLSIAAATGVIEGTPDTADANTADATVTVRDAAGNTGTVDIAFPAVARGDQTLTGFQYSASSVTFGSTAPTVTAPGGVVTTLSYSATPSTVCTVNSTTGALTLAGVGSCVITATAAGTDDYDETTAMFTVAVQAAGALVLNLDAIAVDDTVNIAEKTAGFTISGDTASEAGVSVTVTVGATELTATSADDNGTATWSVRVPADASYITGTSVNVTVSATKTGFTAPGDVQRTLTVDLTAPTAPTYTAPGSLKVGVAIAAMGPSGGIGIDGYSATGLPPGLSIDTGTGVIDGTPDTADATTADATVTVRDAAGNTGTVDIAFPAVAKGDQTLTGFQYSASSVAFGAAAPTVTAPGGVVTTLSYSATPSTVCTVNASSGALTLAGVGSCVITATAAGTDDYDETTVTFTVAVQAVGALVLNLDAVATDNTINIDEKTAGFSIGGNTGSEAGVSVTVTVGSTELTATSTDDNGTATWSVSVPADASYITGASLVVEVNATKIGFTAPAAITRTLTVDLTAPTAPSYNAPTSLKVGEAMTAISPLGGIGIDAYSATGLPPGLSIDTGTGAISGTPDTADANTADATVTVSDTAGNSGTVDITFPAVAKGDQTLTGFQYSASSVAFGAAAPTVTAPGGVETTLSYSATPSTVCTVNASSGVLALAGVGSCVITATAAGTDDYDETTVTFTVTVQAAGALVLNLDTIAVDDTVNIAEKTAGFTISGDTASEAGVSITVTVGSTELTATSADDNGTATWSVSVPSDASYITGTRVDVTVSATKTGFTAPGDVQRTLTVDLTAPTAPTYTAPDSLKVGVAIAAMGPSGGTGINAYSATRLPPGLSIDTGTGVIGGTPDTAQANTASVTVTASDTAGNTAEVSITFPAVAKGDQTLTGFQYSASSVTLLDSAPSVTAPTGVQTTLSYSATPSTACTVNSSSGALTLAGVGSCVITATAAGNDDYNEATATFTVAVQAAGELALNLDAVATDNTVNVAEKTAGFTISGDTGTESGVDVTVQIGTETLTATSADNAGTATWSVSVPADASYITGPSVAVEVNASKTDYTSPSAITRTLTVDLTAPTAPTYTAPASLKVGVAITAMSPTGGIGIDAYSATGLPPGLSIAAATGVIGGTPDTAEANTTSVTVTASDTAGNTAEVSITFPAVAKGDQTLTGFQYSASSATFGSTAPTVTAPGGVETTLSYAAAPSEVCTVDPSSGALTLAGVGSCVITATAAGTDDYNEATATFTVTVQAAVGTLVLNLDAVATDNTINVAEKTAGFTISGDTGTESGVDVTVQIGTETLTATSADNAGTATWSVSVPADASYITGTSVDVTVSAAKTGFIAPGDVQRTLTVDLTAPTAPTYTAPASLKVGVAIAAMSPTDGTGIDEYSATGLPAGLSIAAATGVIGGTPDTADANTADATVTVSDTAGNTAEMSITFPAVARGDQTLTGFQYSAPSVAFGSAAPTVTAPGGVETTLSYAATPSAVCTVNASTGALTLAGVGNCEVTATAASTANYNEATATFTVTVQAVGALVLNLDAVATDNTVNIAEKTAGFTISGDTGTESGVDVTVTVGTTELTATSAEADPATWSVSVPADASYITGTSVNVTVSATKTGYTAPDNVERTLTVDLTAPTAPTYTAPDSLKVGVAIAAMSPTDGSGIDEYSATGLPPGLSIAAATGVIDGTPDTADPNTADAMVTASDTAGNTAEVSITFPAVAKGDQTLTGFQYSASSVTLLDSAPSVTAPTGVQTTLSYSATPAAVCTVNSSSGALTLAGVGGCVITATAAGTDDYNEATATFTVAVQAVGTLVLNLDAVATDNTVNIAEKVTGFTIGGGTGSVGGVSVTVTVGTTVLTATSSDADPATWSVSVPANASYITGTSVDVEVNASKIGYTAPSAIARTVTVDLTAPAAPTYTAPASLTVGVAISAISPTGGVGIDEYAVTGLPSGLSLDTGTGAIGGTPDTADANAASATVTVSDAAGNTAEVSIAFPAVAKRDQTLSGFQYSASSVTFGSAAPTVTAPTGVQTTVSYAATPSTVCTVDSSTGALTLVGAGECVVTATAASTANYNEASATYTVTVQAAGTSGGRTDSTAVTLTVDPATVNEGAGATALTVTGTLDEAPRTSDSTVTVSVGAGGDSAVAGTDYAAVGELKLTIEAGQTSGTVTFTLTPTDDGLIEGDETLTVTGTTGLADLTVTGTSITIGDDDERRVAISPTSLTVAEGDSASYTVVLGSRPSGTVRVRISGTTGTDLRRSRSFLSFRTSNWNEPQTVTVTARQDEDAEDDTVTLVACGHGSRLRSQRRDGRCRNGNHR